MNDITLFALCMAIPAIVYFAYQEIARRFSEMVDAKLIAQSTSKIIKDLERFRNELDRADSETDLVNIIKVTKYPFKAKAEYELHFPLEYIHGYGYYVSMETTMELQNDIREYEKIENKDFPRDIRYIKSMVDERLSSLKKALSDVEDCIDD